MENWGQLCHLFVPVFLSSFSLLLIGPAIPDVTLEAVCPGKDECSAAIYLTGFQQAISGVGSIIMMPLIGNLSDVYGRKAMLLIPLLLSILPSAILVWKRTTSFFYAYYAMKTLTAMVTQNGVMCVALAYLADNISVGNRVSAFGLLAGVAYAACLGGTLAARLLSTTRIFQVATALSALAAVYTAVFLKETSRKTDVLEQPMIEDDEHSCKRSNRMDFIRNIPSPRDIYYLLRSSTTFSLAASVTFFNSLAEAGSEICLLYFLKVRFGFKKDQFADFLLIASVGATLSNMIIMPTFGPLIGEEKLLSLGLFSGFLLMLFDSIAREAWVPYASASLSLFVCLSRTNLQSIISKQVGPSEQGLAQGCILAMTALASVISPLIYSPLTALTLAEDAPFAFQGLSILCVGLAWLVGFVLSIMMPILSKKKSKNGIAKV